jgi:hypothetical protein
MRMGIGEIKGPGGTPEPTPVGVNKPVGTPAKSGAASGAGANTFALSAEGRIVARWDTATPNAIADDLRFHPNLAELVGPMGIIGAMLTERQAAIAAALVAVGEERLANKVRMANAKKKTVQPPSDAGPTDPA